MGHPARKGQLLPYSLNAYLFSSQACEATFKTARSLTGAFSLITNFSVHEFLNRIGKISIFNHLKSTEESSDSTCTLKFPIHHKHQRNDSNNSINNQNLSTLTLKSIEKIIIQAYHEAELIMQDLKLTETLHKQKLNDLNTLSSFVFQRISKNLTIDYSAICNSYDEEDSDDDNQNSKSMSLFQKFSKEQAKMYSQPNSRKNANY
ncbi:hypothetical protein I4U23_000060 [Adineta vaga]|nr:hypothetical protein I4U23_000060 [Adineta vaga]